MADGGDGTQLSRTVASRALPPTVGHHAVMYLAAWALIAALMTSLNVQAALPGRSVGWLRMFGPTLAALIPWVVGSPVVFALGGRLPIDRGTWRWALPLHVVLAAAWVAASLTGVVFFHLALGGGALQGDALPDVPPVRFLVDALAYAVIAAAGQQAALRRQLREEAERAAERAAELRVANEQLERQLATARLHTLRARVQPHFLFNVLNSISALVRRGDGAAALAMIGGVSDLLRHALRPRREQMVTLGEEIGIVRAYLELERLRLGERLRVTLDVPEELTLRPVPDLLLQPIVENAVRHGVAELATPGEVSVSARRVGDELVLSVRNSGPPMRAGWSPERDSGTGLSITRERLRSLYGDAQRFELANAPGGVEARVVIPWAS